MAASKFSSDSDELVADINITPFVDVVLVLLVIFIVMAPVIAKNSIDIKLPKAASSDGPKTKTLGITVNQQGQILIDGVATDYLSLETRVKTELMTDPELQAVISADGSTAHRDVVRAIDWLKRAGIVKFAVQVEKSENPDTP